MWMKPENTEPVTYRAFRDGDEPAVVGFFNFIFGRSLTVRDWEWAYRENPARQMNIVLAHCGPALVGVLAATPLPFCCDKKPCAAIRMQDGMVHPDYRGRGIFVGLVNALTELIYSNQLDLVVQFPNNNSFPVFMNRLAYDHPCDIPTLHLAAGRLTPTKPSDITIEIVDPGLLDLCDVDFVVRHLSQYAMFNTRSLDYLRWRYGSRSGKDYFVLRARRGGRQVALAVFKLYKAASSVDLLEFVIDTPSDIIPDLLTAIHSFYKGDGIPVTGFNIWSLPHYADHDRLLHAGFEPTGLSTHLITKSYSHESTDKSARMTSYYLSMGDSDVY